jgi:hypothetical protein
MPPLIAQLEALLRELLAEQLQLVQKLDVHLKALRTFKSDAIEQSSREQEIVRQRIARVEARRKVIAAQFLRLHRNISTPSISAIAELYPDHKPTLLAIRSELLRVMEAIRQRTQLIERIVTGVVGHLNATVRVIAQAAVGPSTYTRGGDVAIPTRVSVMNAVG